MGQLVSFSGTVTRTSEIRPELMYGTFKCMDCGTIVKDVQQDFAYTEVCWTRVSFILGPGSPFVFHFSPRRARTRPV